MPGDPTATTPPAGHRTIGRLGRAFQLDGGIRLHLTDPQGSDALDVVERVFVVGHGPARLRRLRRHGPDVIVYLEGVRDRDAARALVGCELSVPAPVARPQGTDTDPRARSLADLPVVVGTVEVGRVVDIRFASVNPVLVVATSGGGEALVPLGAPYVSVSPDRVELVDPPAGLLDPR